MSNNSKRWIVKLYKTLGNSDWVDLGLGFLGFEGPQLTIWKEEEGIEKIYGFEVKEEVFHRQGDNILTWLSHEKVNYGLSLPDKTSVIEVLQELFRIQRGNIEDFNEDHAEEDYALLSPNIENLDSILDELVYGLKDRLECDILNSDFLNKLSQIAGSVQEPDKKSQHLLCLIYKQLCNTYLVHLTSDLVISKLIENHFEVLLKVLKHDPDLNGKEFDLLALYNNSKFINALDVEDSEFLDKISKINKLMFIKDTALTRSLEDHACTFLVIETHILLKEVIELYIKSQKIRNSLYEKLEAKDNNALKFLIDLVGIGKTCTAQDRHVLFESLFHDGIISLIERNSYEEADGKFIEFVGELFCCVIDVSPFIIRNLFFNGYESLGSQFISHISNQILTTSNPTILQDLSKFLRTLIDPEYSVFDKIQPIFYSETIPLFLSHLAPSSEPTTVCELLDIFSDCIQKHKFKALLFTLVDPLLPLLPSLLTSNKHTAVHSLKLLRSLVTRNEKSLNSLFLRSKLISQVLTCLELNSIQENLVFSVSLNVCLKIKESQLSSTLNPVIYSTLKRLNLTCFAYQFEACKTLLPDQ